jgi:hypothetical protein
VDRWPRAPSRRSLLAGALLTLASWHLLGVIKPSPGLDPSWQMGIQRAVEEGRHFGTEVMFDYGPLGFLRLPAYWYVDLTIIALSYSVVTGVALGAVLWQTSRGALAPIPAALVCLLAMSAQDDPLPILVFAIAFGLVRRPPEGLRARAGAGAGLGALAATELLVKINSGLMLVAMCTAAAVSLPRPWGRLLLATAAGFAATLVGEWLALGQSLGTLDDYARNGLALISGYAEAQGREDPGRIWEYSAAAALLVGGTILTLGTARDADRRVRRGLLALWLIFSFVTFKGAFIRHDAHSLYFFAALLAVLPVWLGSTGFTHTGTATLCIALVAYLGAAGIRATDLVDPLGRARNAGHDLKVALDGSRREALRAEGRAWIVATERVDPATLALLAGHTTHVAWYETAIAWAYDLKWQPLPVFQSYAAYTPRLDDLNARLLASRDAPERILVHREEEVDQRLVQYDMPHTVQNMVCRYSVLRTTARYLVLGRRAASRCSAERRIASVRAAWNTPVSVPRAPPASMVLVRIRGIEPSGLEALRGFVFKPHARTLVVDGRPHRLVSANAGNGLIVSSDATRDWPGPFRLSPQARTIAVSRTGAPGGKPVQLTFTEMRVGP